MSSAFDPERLIELEGAQWGYVFDWECASGEPIYCYFDKCHWQQGASITNKMILRKNIENIDDDFEIDEIEFKIIGEFEKKQLPLSEPLSLHEGKRDPMFDEVMRFVVENQNASASVIQRRFSIGFNRAGRLVDQLEAAGIVGKADGSKPRKVLIDSIGKTPILESKKEQKNWAIEKILNDLEVSQQKKKEESMIELQRQAQIKKVNELIREMNKCIEQIENRPLWTPLVFFRNLGFILVLIFFALGLLLIAVLGGKWIYSIAALTWLIIPVAFAEVFLYSTAFERDRKNSMINMGKKNREAKAAYLRYDRELCALICGDRELIDLAKNTKNAFQEQIVKQRNTVYVSLGLILVTIVVLFFMF